MIMPEFRELLVSCSEPNFLKTKNHVGRASGREKFYFFWEVLVFPKCIVVGFNGLFFLFFF